VKHDARSCIYARGKAERGRPRGGLYWSKRCCRGPATETARYLKLDIWPLIPFPHSLPPPCVLLFFLPFFFPPKQPMQSAGYGSVTLTGHFSVRYSMVALVDWMAVKRCWLLTTTYVHSMRDGRTARRAAGSDDKRMVLTGLNPSALLGPMRSPGQVSSRREVLRHQACAWGTPARRIYHFRRYSHKNYTFQLFPFLSALNRDGFSSRSPHTAGQKCAAWI
jgi:hypothetical protein